MAANIKFKKGLKSALPALALGEPALTTDEERMYVGGNSGNIGVAMQSEFNAHLAENANVKQYGAKGDGITDDTQAFINALTALNSNGGGILWIPPTNGMKYKINGSIEVSLTSDITIISAPGVILDGTESTQNNLFYVHGSKGTSASLGADAAKLATTLTTSLTLAAGDIILITSTTLWNPTRSYYYKGEMVEVESVSGTTVTLRSPLLDSYTASTTTIYKLTMPKITIENLNIKRNANYLGLYVQYAKDIEVKNCSVSGARYAAFTAEYIYGGMIENCKADDCWYTGTGNSYGLQIDSSQNINVIGGRYLGGRHGITTGGEEPCRYINIDGVQCSSKFGAGSAGLDFHGNIEFANVRNCYCTGDMGIDGNPINITVNNCRIIGEVNSGIEFYMEVGYDGYVEIKDCFIESKGYGIEVRPISNNLSMDKIEVSGNTVKTTGVGIVVSPVSGATGFHLRDFIALDNNVVTSTAKQAMNIGDYSSNLMTIDRAKISGRYLSGGHNDSILVNLDTNSDVTIEKAKISTSATGGLGVDVLSCRNLSLVDSHIYGNPTLAYMVLSANNIIKLKDNRIESFTSNGGAILNNAGSPFAKTFLHADNDFISCTGTIRKDTGTSDTNMLTT